MESLRGPRGARSFGLVRRHAVRAFGVVSLGTAALVVGPLANNPASAASPVVTLAPGSITVPAVSTYYGSLTVNITGGTPSTPDPVTVSESDTGSGNAGCTANLDASGNGSCNITTNHDTTIENGTVTATETLGGVTSGATTVHFTNPGSPPTGVALAVSGFTTHGPPGPSPADAFSDGNRYFIGEPSNRAADFDQTTSEAKIAASLTGATGDQPWAIKWAIHNTGSGNIFLDAVANTATLGAFPAATNVICQSLTSTDPNGANGGAPGQCTPGSYDLDQAAHFSNPATPGTNDLGTVNNTLPAFNTTIIPNGTRTFTTYMTGALNNAFIVLDSHGSSATVTATAFDDPAGTTSADGTGGHAQGASATTPSIVWAGTPSGTSTTGAIKAFDPNPAGAPDPANDWVVITAPTVLQLVNFDQTSAQTYSANGAATSEATFESNLAGGTFPTYAATNYGAANQANALTSSAPPPPPPPPRGGYWMVAKDGGIFAFHDAQFFGSMGGQHLNAPMVGMAATTDSLGYWTVAKDGGIFSFGNAQFFGSMGGKHLNAPMVGMASPDNAGYWTVASDGGIFSFGDATFFGSTGGIHLNQPIVGMAVTPDDQGYWLVASDGGIFSFGSARFFGSMGGVHLNKPVVGMDVSPDGKGYWLVASDGGIFSFGSAQFFGSAGNIRLNAPMVGMSATFDGGGYYTVATDGGIFAYGDAQFFGSMGAIRLNQPMVGMAYTSA